MPLDSQQLAQFVAIADTGSYRRAAERLGIAQPALTVSIKKMEHSLRVDVFQRTPQGVTLTPAGRALLEHARHALAVIDTATRAARAAHAGMTGELRLGFVGTAACNLLPRILPLFAARFPLIRLQLVEGATPSLLHDLDRELLDACIVRENGHVDPRHEVRTLERDTLAAVLPARHVLAARKRLKLADLQDEPYVGVVGDSKPFVSAGVSRFCTAQGFVPRVVQSAHRAQTVVSLVGCGLGYSLLPAVASTYRNDNVKFVPVDAGQFELNLHLSVVWLKDGASATVGHFVDLIGETCGREGV